jgi:hypothetical protein
MKKFKFLAVVITALFMFVGVQSQAQKYVPASQAIDVLNDAIQNTNNSISVRNDGQSASYFGEIIKMRYAGSLVDLIQKGESVSDAFSRAEAHGKFPSNASKQVADARIYFEQLLSH